MGTACDDINFPKGARDPMNTEALPEPRSGGISATQKAMIFRNMSDGIMTVGENGQITYVNAALLEIFHFEKEEDVLGKSFEKIFLHNKKNHAFNKFFSLATEKRQPTEKTFLRYRMDNGEKLYLDIDVSLMDQNWNHISEDRFPGMMILIENATDRFTLRQREHDYAYIFAGIIFCITSYLMAWSCIRFTLGIQLHTSVYTMIIEVITFALFLEIVFFTSFSLKEIGLVPRWKKFKQNMLETLTIAVISGAVLVLSKIILALFGIQIKSYFLGGSWRGLANYGFTALLQEFLARGVIQTSVKSLMRIKYQKTLGIILTSLLFSLMHMPFGFIFMMGALVLSLALGYLFERQGDLWGCALLHWFCGYLTMCLYF